MPETRRRPTREWPIIAVAMLGVLAVTLPSRPGAQRSPAGNGLSAPAGRLPARMDRAGVTVLPNGRLITPRGVQVTVAPHPYGLALSPDGTTLVTVNSGTSPFSVSIITGLHTAQPTVRQIPPASETESSDASLKSVFLGAAIAPDNRILYVSEGNRGCIGIFDLATRRRLGSLSLDTPFAGRNYKDSLVGELRLSPGGRRLYALDLAHFRLVVFDTQSHAILASVAVGYLPFGLAISPDGQWAWVSNVGMFQYALVPGYDPGDPQRTGLSFPPFGFPSKQSEFGASMGSRRIPGLGDPNSPRSDIVWVVDVSIPAVTEVRRKIPTGIPAGPAALGGSSPGAVVVGRKFAFVSNASDDSVTMIDSVTFKVRKAIELEPAPSVRGLRGVLPFGMALSPDEKRLYVACAGINAVAVLDARRGAVLGYIPAAWFPARVAVGPRGRTLYVANAKGFGSGPNGGASFRPGAEGAYIGDIMKGTVSVIPVPSRRELKAGAEQVLTNNGFVPSVPPPAPAEALSAIHHVVVIVKENRTFDQVLGDLGAVNGEAVNGDPALAEYGTDAAVGSREDSPGAARPGELDRVRVTPNQHALARRFGVSDNYYVDGDVSVDGHHWLVGAYPNEVVEAGWPASYGGELDFRPDPQAPGRLELGATEPWPESFPQAGTLWERLKRHGVTFRNYGEGLEMAGYRDGPHLEPTGIREPTNMPISEALFENTSHSYPTFNTNISDQYRFLQFRREFTSRYESRNQALPSLIWIWLPNDHTAKPRPASGYPYRASYVADNDYALGRIVELLSHSRFWRDMAIFVTEDDAQGGTDHVDAHRSLLLVVSPYSRRGVSHVHTSIASILKTIDEIFRLPYLNQYDAAATDLAGCFTGRPDFAPYVALPPDTRIFDPQKAVEADAHGVNSSKRPPSARLDDPAAIRKEMRRKERRGR